MSEYVGPLQRIALSRTLWLVVALPLLAAAVQLVLARRAASSRVARVGIVGIAAALVAVIAHGVELARLPADERFLFAHLWRLVRVGQLDVNLDLALDPLSAIACGVVASAALVAAIVVPESSPVRLACRSLVVGATLLVVLADGFVVAIAAAELVTVAAWALARDGRRSRVLVGGLAADAPFVAGAVLLFWGLGGGWAGGGYTPDLSPRFVAVHDADPTAANPSTPRPSAPRDDDDDDEPRRFAPGDGLLTLTSSPGAIVFVDDARTPITVGDRPLRSPFVRHPVRGGLHTFRIHSGGSTDDYVVSRVVVEGGREIALTVVGPSVTFRHIQDELAVRPVRGGSTTREDVARRTLGDVRVVTLACILLFVGLAARLAMASSIAAAAAPVYVLARLAFLLPLSHVACAVAACAALLFALGAAVSACRESDAHRILVRVGVAQGFVALAALALGAHAAAILVVVVDALALGALGVSAKDGRASFVACAAIAIAPVPFVGAFWPLSELVVSAFTSRAIAPLPTLVPLASVVAALAGSSFAIWRRHYALFGGRRPAAREGRIGMALAVSALASGPLLGASRRIFGNRGETILESWLEPVFARSRAHFADAGNATGLALVLALFGASMAAWAIARRRTHAVVRDETATGNEENALSVAVVTRPVLGLASLVASLDRWVIDGVLRALVATVRAFAWMGARADEQLVDAPANRAASVALRGLAPLRRLAALQTWFYALLVAAFVAVVLYSVFAAA